MNIHQGTTLKKKECERVSHISSAFAGDKRSAFLLTKKDEVPFVYHVAKLEGNPLGYEEVKTLLDGISVGGHKLSDIQMIINLQKSFDFIMKSVTKDDFSVTKKFILELHSLIAYEEALEWGAFKQSVATVQAGDDQFVSPRIDTPDVMADRMIKLFTQDKHPIVNAFEFFAEGAYSQLFYDGNKRTARLAASAYLLSKGFPPISILASNTLEFHLSLSEMYKTDDPGRLYVFLADNYLKHSRQIGFPFIDEEKLVQKDSLLFGKCEDVGRDGFLKP